MRLFAIEWQVSDLVDNEQPRALGVIAQGGRVALLPAGRRQLQHEVGGGHEARLVACPCSEVTQRQRQMGLAHAGRPEENDVLVPLNEREAGELLDGLLRGTSSGKSSQPEPVANEWMVDSSTATRRSTRAIAS